MKCIKDKEGKYFVQKRDIRDRWMKYFHNLCNQGYEILLDSNKLDIRGDDQNYNDKNEVKEALKRMSNDKTVGSKNIHIEVWKSLGDIDIGVSPNFLMKLSGKRKY